MLRLNCCVQHGLHPCNLNAGRNPGGGLRRLTLAQQMNFAQFVSVVAQIRAEIECAAAWPLTIWKGLAR